jgi:N-acetylmuramoyl-L-alanine amidase
MPTVVIDPGHGGSDPGTVGNGFREKDINLDTGLKLYTALQRCGIHAILTRSTDTLLVPDGITADDLAARARIANENEADFFLSWHINASNDATVNGVSVWIHPSQEGKPAEAKARQIVNAIAAATGQKNRGVYLGDFQVLRDTYMDAVLVEAGFLTNASEAALLGNPDFRWKQAEAAALAVCQIVGVTYIPPVESTSGDTGEIDPDWARQAIQMVKQWGVMAGDPNGAFRPNDPVTRAELAAALVNFYHFMKGGQSET